MALLWKEQLVIQVFPNTCRKFKRVPLCYCDAGNAKSGEKDALRLCGADLRLVPAVPYRDPNNYVRYSERLANELREELGGGVIWANQFDNTANRQGHIDGTGPEIWEQTSGKIDGFICAVGSGGTLGGLSLYLKGQNPNIQIGLS